ncbi:MAG: DUF4845 domain-containing protein [Ectothiorhodospiraceae bacterium]|jgi:hypothetical protein
MYAKQKGMTLIGWLVTLVIVGVAALVAMRLVPVYIEAYSVGSILQTMESEARLDGTGRGDIRDTFRKRLTINDLAHVKASDLEFSDVAGGVQVVVKYEARVHLLGNLDAVAKFRKEAVIRN